MLQRNVTNNKSMLTDCLTENIFSCQKPYVWLSLSGTSECGDTKRLGSLVVSSEASGERTTKRWVQMTVLISRGESYINPIEVS